MQAKKVKIYTLIILIVIGVLTCIHPIYPREQFLQHLGTILLLVILWLDIKQNRLSLFSFICVSLFILIHVIGARYIYSTVPYDAWIKRITGISINGFFGFTRNHYDRFVHFSFGLLALPYLVEIIGSKRITSFLFRILVAWACVQTISMLYELFEWFLTLVLTTEAATDYNGQQGDMWDAQKDMALAMLGSTIMALYFILRKDRYNRLG